MALKVEGSLTIEAMVNDETEELVILASEFGLEEGSMRHLGDGDYQYEALYIHFGDGFEISFQVTNMEGNVSIYPYSISDDIEIISDDISVLPLNYEVEDYF